MVATRPLSGLLNHRAAAGCAAAVLGLLAGCTSGATAPEPSDVTVTHTVVRTTNAPVATFVPRSPTPVAPLAPSATPAREEVEKDCPYIASQRTGNGDDNITELTGSHVLRTTVLTSTKPVGCRFYFYAPPFRPVADIVPTSFGSATEAYNAMVLTGKAGAQVAGKSDIVPGVDAVLFRTPFVEGDDGRNWACAFAKGNVMVVVHTQRTDTSLPALRVAERIAGRF